MLDLFACCIAPILLIFLFTFSFVTFTYNLAVWPQSVEKSQTNYNLYSKPIIIIVGLAIILAIISFIWVWFTDQVIYQQLFYLDSVLAIIIMCVIVAAILFANKRVAQYLGASEFHLVVSLAFSIAGAIFWLAMLPYLMLDFQHIDQIKIDTNIYNLAYVESSEGHAHFVLFECGERNIFCKEVASSKLDYCRSFQYGKLYYEQATQELSAEASTCFNYTAFVYTVE